MDPIRNGTIIVIPETEKDNSKLVHVLRRANDLTISDRRVSVGDLLKALYGMMESFELSNLILTNGDQELRTIFQPIFEAEGSQGLINCMNLILDWAAASGDTTQLLVLFRLLTEKFDFSKIDEKSLNQMLVLLLNRVSTLNDASDFNQLFITLLGKVNISDANKELIGTLLKELANRAVKEKDINIKRWFQEQIAAYVPRQKTITTPLLPYGTILYQEEVSGHQIVVLEIEKKRWNINYYKTPYESVGHPKMLFEFVIRGKSIEGCRIFALKNGNVKSSSKLYRYPFGNVNSNNVACWPQLNEIEINRLTQLRNLPQLFFNSPTNDHLYDGKNQREKILALQGNDFDDEVLVDTGLTFADQFEMLNVEEDEEEIAE